LGGTEKKLTFEWSQLKAKLASKEVELDTERQGCQTFERALRAQVIEVEQRRDDAWPHCVNHLGNLTGSRRSVKVSRVLI
jgi:hypothetical protein